MGAARDPGAAAGCGAARRRCELRPLPRRRGSARRSPSISRCSRTASPRPTAERARSPTCTRSSPTAASPCTSAGPGTSASSRAACRRRCRTPGRPRRCPRPIGAIPASRSPAARASRSARTSAHQDAAWQLVEFLAGTAQQVRFYALSGNLPARTAAWQDPALAGDRRAQAFFDAAAARPRAAQDPGMGAHRGRDHAPGRAAGARRRARSRPRSRRSTPRSTRSSRSGAGCSTLRAPTRRAGALRTAAS